MTDATTNATTDDAIDSDLRASRLAARIMGRLRGHNLLSPDGAEEQDEFEAMHLTPLLREALDA